MRTKRSIPLSSTPKCGSGTYIITLCSVTPVWTDSGCSCRPVAVLQVNTNQFLLSVDIPTLGEPPEVSGSLVLISFWSQPSKTNAPPSEEDEWRRNSLKRCGWPCLRSGLSESKELNRPPRETVRCQTAGSIRVAQRTSYGSDVRRSLLFMYLLRVESHISEIQQEVDQPGERLTDQLRRAFSVGSQCAKSHHVCSGREEQVSFQPPNPITDLNHSRLPESILWMRLWS